jgi:GT2 family glycosyltransferase
MTALKLAALVPTYRRPDFLRRCVAALRAQRRPFDCIAIVTREADQASCAAVRELAGDGALIVSETVGEAGHLPPLVAGRRLLPRDVDVVVIVDDDLLLAEDGAGRVERHFRDPRVGVVGGRAIEHDHGVARPAVHGRGGGDVSFAGTIYAGHSHTPARREVREAGWAAGLLAAYRRTAFDRIQIRPRLNQNVAVGYEVDWGLQCKGLGYRVLFDPDLVGAHHNAPRHHGTARAERSAARVFWQNHNHTYILLHHLRGPRRLVYLASSFLVGRGDWGLGAALSATVRRRSLEWRGLLLPAYRGKLAGLRAYLGDRAGE